MLYRSITCLYPHQHDVQTTVAGCNPGTTAFGVWIITSVLSAVFPRVRGGIQVADPSSKATHQMVNLIIKMIGTDKDDYFVTPVDDKDVRKKELRISRICTTNLNEIFPSGLHWPSTTILQMRQAVGKKLKSQRQAYINLVVRMLAAVVTMRLCSSTDTYCDAYAHC
jgi:hypothetical protein